MLADTTLVYPSLLRRVLIITGTAPLLYQRVISFVFLLIHVYISLAVNVILSLSEVRGTLSSEKIGLWDCTENSLDQ